MGKLFLVASLLLGLSAFAAQDQFVKVDINGVLHSDVQGHRYSVSVNGFNYDLDLSRNIDLRRFADNHDGELVSVRGFLFSEPGRDGNCPHFVIGPSSIDLLNRPTMYDDQGRVIENPPVREREVIIEKKPLFKAGPLEIK